MEQAAVAPPEIDDFTDFFHHYRRRAFAYALQLSGNRDDAMDLTQEAFLRLHRHWPRRDPARSPAPWFYAILRNLAIDLLRRRAASPAPAPAAPAAAPDPGPEAAAARGELAALLWRAIERLPPDQREALLLRDWHGLSYAEIAHATGVAAGTVGARIHDARTALRNQLGRYL